MKYHELNVMSNKDRKRVGRGIAAGQGKTAGRGTKGQNSRTGGGVRPGFEGGQNPLMQRLPKLRGFHSRFPKARIVYTGQLSELKAKTIDTFVLAEAGLLDTPYQRAKLLNRGDITKPLNVKLQAASATAVTAIEKAGGSFEVAPRLQREAKKSEVAAK